MIGYSKTLALAIVGTFLALTPAVAAERWDMPTAYAPSNFHSQTAVMFADAVGRATNGELEIVVHPGGSLFAGAEIKRAVQKWKLLG